MGEWIYQYSYINGWKRVLSHPVNKFMFIECIDSIELQDSTYPGKYIVNMRKENILKDLKYQTFDTFNKLIDTYYPVARFSKDTLIQSLMVSEFGINGMSDFKIDELNDSLLEIHDHRYYTLNDKKYNEVFHFYRKIKK